MGFQMWVRQVCTHVDSRKLGRACFVFQFLTVFGYFFQRFENLYCATDKLYNFIQQPFYALKHMTTSSLYLAFGTVAPGLF